MGAGSPCPQSPLSPAGCPVSGPAWVKPCSWVWGLPFHRMGGESVLVMVECMLGSYCPRSGIKQTVPFPWRQESSEESVRNTCRGLGLAEQGSRVFTQSHALWFFEDRGVEIRPVGRANAGRSKDGLSERMGWSPHGLQEACRPRSPSTWGVITGKAQHTVGHLGVGRTLLGPSRWEILGVLLLWALNSSLAPSGERGW